MKGAELMSSANPSHQVVRGQRNREEDHPYWMQTFQSDLRSQQLSDDQHAWAAVAGTLLTIVTFGATLAAISVALCL
jgi:hypothetical protein